jgi:hypothetical protein
MGIGIQVHGLSTSFGSQRIWEDVTFDLPAGEVSVLLGPSGTGKSVFLKSLIGLLRPERGKIIVDGTNIIECSAKELYEIRTLFGVMFQDGALFGSMNLFDNTAFPLREHTKKKESEIRQIVMEKLEMVGLGGDENKFPGGDLRRYAQACRAGAFAGARPADHPLRRARLGSGPREIMHTLPPKAQAAIRGDLEGTHHLFHDIGVDGRAARHRSDDDAPTASVLVGEER